MDGIKMLQKIYGNKTSLTFLLLLLFIRYNVFNMFFKGKRESQLEDVDLSSLPPPTMTDLSLSFKYACQD